MSAVPLNYFLTVSALLFGFGLYGALRRTNAIMILMSIELMLNAANINLVAVSRFLHDDPTLGQVFALFVIAVAAAEVAVGLAIVLAISKKRRTINVNEINMMKG